MKQLKNIEIAKALNISPAAVSIARNNKPGVSEETRQIIQAYIDQFEKTSSNSELYNVKTGNSIILCIHKRHGAIIIEKPFFSGLIEAIQTEAASEGYSLIISHYDPSMDLSNYITSLSTLNASGVIVMATEMQEQDVSYYQNLSIPFVLMDCGFDSIPCDSVTIDNVNTIIRAFTYAYNMGHRKIGFLQSNTYISNFEYRYDGFLKAQRKFNPDVKDYTIFKLSPSIEASYKEMSNILEHLSDNFDMPTCFLSDLDYIAVGAMQAFKAHNFLVPDDISFIGFDDVEFTQVCTPALTTIHLHQETIGRQAVKLLKQRIDGLDSSYMNLCVGSELVIRNSVKQLIKAL